MLAAISLMAAHGEATPRSMTLIGGPIDARRGPTTINEFAVSKPLDRFARTDRYGAGYLSRCRTRGVPGFLQHAAFVAMNPERHLNSHLRYYCDVAAGNREAADAHRRFYDEYNAVLDRHLSPKVRVFVDWIAEQFDRCPLMSGRGGLDKTCTQRTYERRESAPTLDTPVVSEWVA
ncbi:hypothetical protein [Paraburkholderia sprentiae]|nr:hypothetical protein [Paraburkholderia sprentiae]